MQGRQRQRIFLLSLAVSVCWHVHANERVPEGFVPLFNGQDLSGWQGRGHENPKKFAALPEAARAEKTGGRQCESPSALARLRMV